MSSGIFLTNKFFMKFFILSFFLFLLAPCNASKKVSSPDARIKTDHDPKTVIIVYHRTVCFGKCPAFTLTINGEKRTATYKGEMNVKKIGEYEKEITEQELINFISAFEKYHFFELKDNYASPATDHPSKVTTYTVDGKTKKVDDMQGAPSDLKALEKILEDFADSEGWEKINKE
jgi:hypothetical protein